MEEEAEKRSHEELERLHTLDQGQHRIPVCQDRAGQEQREMRDVGHLSHLPLLLPSSVLNTLPSRALASLNVRARIALARLGNLGGQCTLPRGGINAGGASLTRNMCSENGGWHVLTVDETQGHRSPACNDSFLGSDRLRYHESRRDTYPE